MEKFVRGAGMQIQHTIFFKSIQLLAYADDIDIMGRSENDIKKAFPAYISVIYCTLYHSAEEMGLTVNEGKTKYMIGKNVKENLKPIRIAFKNYEF